MSSFNTKKFKNLKAKWYKKLENDGFKDIETEKQDLKISAREIFRKSRAYSRQSKEDYYCLADMFLHSYKFNNELERIIWEYHVNGIGAGSIADTLNKTKVTKTNRTTVGIVIKDLKELMKKKYVKGYND